MACCKAACLAAACLASARPPDTYSRECGSVLPSRSDLIQGAKSKYSSPAASIQALPHLSVSKKGQNPTRRQKQHQGQAVQPLPVPKGQQRWVWGQKLSLGPASSPLTVPKYSVIWFVADVAQCGLHSCCSRLHTHTLRVTDS